MLFEVPAQKVQVNSRSHFKQLNQTKQCLNVITVLIAVREQYLTQQHQLIPVIPLLLTFPPVLKPLILILHHTLNLITNPVRQRRQILHPAVRPLGQVIHNVQEDVVVALFGLGVFCERLLDVGCLAGEFLPEREGFVQLDQFEETLVVEFALLVVAENRLS